MKSEEVASVRKRSKINHERLKSIYTKGDETGNRINDKHEIENKVKEIGCQCEIKRTKNNVKHLNKSKERDKHRIQKNTSNCSAELGSIRTIKKRRQRKIYLPEHIEMGVGSSNVMTVRKKSKRKRSLNHFIETALNNTTEDQDLQLLKTRPQFSDTAQGDDYNNSQCLKTTVINSSETGDTNSSTLDITINKSDKFKSKEMAKVIIDAKSTSESLQRRFAALKNDSDVKKHIFNSTHNSPFDNATVKEEKSWIQVENETNTKSDVEAKEMTDALQDPHVMNTKESLLTNGVLGMFKLWNENLHFTNEETKYFPIESKASNSKQSKNKLRRFFFFRRRKRKANKPVITGCCQLNDGLILKIEPTNNKNNINKKSSNSLNWVQKFQSSKESDANVHLRWKNRLFHKSSITANDLVESVYNNNIEGINNKTDLFFPNCNIQAYVIHIHKARIYDYNKHTKMYQNEKQAKDKTFTEKHRIHLNISEDSRYTTYKTNLNQFTNGCYSDNCEKVLNNEQVYEIINYDVSMADATQTKIEKDKSVNDKNKRSDIENKSTPNDIIIKTKNLHIPQKCEFIHVNIITQGDLDVGQNHMLQDEITSDENAQYSLHRMEKRCKLTESFLQDYYRSWIPNGTELDSWRISDSQIRCSEDDISTSDNLIDRIYDSSRSCPNIYDLYYGQQTASSQIEIKTNPNKLGHTNFFKKLKYWTVSRTNATKDDKVDFHILPKDSLEVFKKRKIYALSKHAYTNLDTPSEAMESEPKKQNLKKKTNSKPQMVKFKDSDRYKEYSGILKHSSMKCLKTVDSGASKVSEIVCDKPITPASCTPNTNNSSLSKVRSALKTTSRYSSVDNNHACPSSKSCSICKLIASTSKEPKTNLCDASTCPVKDIGTQSSNAKCTPLKGLKPSSGSHESMKYYHWSENSASSKPQNSNRRIPTSPPKCPIQKLSDEGAIVFTRRQSICPTPKCSSHVCKSNDDSSKNIEQFKCSAKWCKEHQETPSIQNLRRMAKCRHEEIASNESVFNPSTQTENCGNYNKGSNNSCNVIKECCRDKTCLTCQQKQQNTPNDIQGIKLQVLPTKKHDGSNDAIVCNTTNNYNVLSLHSRSDIDKDLEISYNDSNVNDINKFITNAVTDVAPTTNENYVCASKIRSNNSQESAESSNILEIDVKLKYKNSKEKRIVTQDEKDVYILNNNSKNNVNKRKSVDIKIIIHKNKNKVLVDNKSWTNKEERTKSSAIDAFTNKISAKLRTVSTGYDNDFSDKKSCEEYKLDTEYSVHRTSIDLSESSILKTGSEIPTIITLSTAASKTSVSASNHDKLKSYHQRTSRSINKLNNQNSTSKEHYISSSNVTNITDNRIFDNIEKENNGSNLKLKSNNSGKSNEQIKSKLSKQEKKDALKDLMEQVSTVQKDNHVKSNFRKELKAILTDSSNPSKHSEISSSNLLINQEISGCMCVKMANKTERRINIPTCCCKKTTQYNDAEISCNLRNELDYSLINIKSNYLSVNAAHSDEIYKKKTKTNDYGIDDINNQEIELLNTVLNKITDKNDVRKKIPICQVKINQSTNLGVTSNESIIFLNNESYSAVDNSKMADILQTDDTKKAVLQIYAENTISRNHLIAKLPKFNDRKDILKTDQRWIY